MRTRRWYVRWLPHRNQAAVEHYAVHGRPVPLLVIVALMVTVASHPLVVRETGVSPKKFFVVWLVLAVWFLGVGRLLYQKARASDAAFHGLFFGTRVVGATVCLAFPVLFGTPQNPLWVAYTVMACSLGAGDSDASFVAGIFDAVAPLLTIPFFLTRGASVTSAVACPLLVSMISSFGYWFLARRGDLGRRERDRRQVLEAQRQLQRSESERQRLSRDLHDGVGTALSLVALYSALVEQKPEDSEGARRLANAIHQSVSDALDDLRGVIQALPQAPIELQELSSCLHLLGSRAARAVGAQLTIRVTEGATVSVGGRARSAIVRIFQEAVHNALRHGFAETIRVELAAPEGAPLRMEVVDDGTGFGTEAPSPGLGLSSIRDRADELGGRADVTSRPGAGTKLRVILPLESAQAVS